MPFQRLLQQLGLKDIRHRRRTGLIPIEHVKYSLRVHLKIYFCYKAVCIHYFSLQIDDFSNSVFHLEVIPIEGLLNGNSIIGLSGFIRHLHEYYTTFTPDAKAT